MSYTYKYERAAITVDGVIFGVDGAQISVLLIQRRNEPFQNNWALPGGFFDIADDSTEDAVARELQEETGLSGLNLEQFFTFSKRGRDPRERTISIAYWAIVDMNKMHPKAADDAKAVRWYQLSELPELAFDHAQIIAKAVESSGVLG